MSTYIRQGAWILTMACGAVALEGCVTTEDIAVGRASNEFSCPTAQVYLLERPDIAENVYDVAACGARARYSCVPPVAEEDGEGRCTREPDPPIWGPDRALMATMPQDPPGRRTWRTCRDGDDRGCIAFENGIWRWRPQVTTGSLVNR